MNPNDFDVQKKMQELDQRSVGLVKKSGKTSVRHEPVDSSPRVMDIFAARCTAKAPSSDSIYDHHENYD